MRVWHGDTLVVLKYCTAPSVTLDSTRRTENRQELTNQNPTYNIHSILVIGGRPLRLLRQSIYAIQSSVCVCECVLICGGHVFGVGEGEAEELVLVQVHDEELVRRCQVHRHLGELSVEVTGVAAVPLWVAIVEGRRGGVMNRGVGGGRDQGKER